MMQRNQKKLRVKNSLNDKLQSYFNEISKIPLLTREEEQLLGAKIQAGDEVAIQQLVESNLRFVVAIAKRYRNFGVSFSDMINEGNLGLIQAARRFDPSRNVRFISYAVWWIRQSILGVICNMAPPMRLPVKVSHTIYKAGIMREKKARDQKRVPAMEEVAAEIGISARRLTTLLNASGEAVSLSQPMENRKEQSLEETLPERDALSVEATLVRECVRKRLREVVQQLGNREQTIIRLRYGLDDELPRSLVEVGQELGLSRERVRQIQERALHKLRRHSHTGGLTMHSIQ